MVSTPLSATVLALSATTLVSGAHVYRGLSGLDAQGPAHLHDPSHASFQRNIQHSFKHREVQLEYQAVIDEQHLPLAKARHVDAIHCVEQDGQVVSLDISLRDVHDGDDHDHPWWNHLDQYTTLSGHCTSENGKARPFHVGMTSHRPSGPERTANPERHLLSIRQLAAKKPHDVFRDLKLKLDFIPMQESIAEDRKLRQLAGVEDVIGKVFKTVGPWAQQLINANQAIPKCEAREQARRLAFFDDLWNEIKNVWSNIQAFGDSNVAVDCLLNPSISVNYNPANGQAAVQSLPFASPDLINDVLDGAQVDELSCENCFFHASVKLSAEVDIDNFIPNRFKASIDALAAGSIGVKAKGTTIRDDALQNLLDPSFLFNFVFNIGSVPVPVGIGVALAAGIESDADTTAEVAASASFKSNFTAFVELDTAATNIWSHGAEGATTTQVVRPVWKLSQDSVSANATFAPEIVVDLFSAMPLHVSPRANLGANVGEKAIVASEASAPETCEVPYSTHWGMGLGLRVGEIELPDMGLLDDALTSFLDALAGSEEESILQGGDLGALDIYHDSPLECGIFCNGCYKDYVAVIDKENANSGNPEGNPAEEGNEVDQGEGNHSLALVVSLAVIGVVVVAAATGGAMYMSTKKKKSNGNATRTQFASSGHAAEGNNMASFNPRYDI